MNEQQLTSPAVDSLSPTWLSRLGRAALRRALGVALLGLGGLSLYVALAGVAGGAFLLGLIVLASAGLEAARVYLLPERHDKRTGYGNAATAFVTGALLVSASELAFRALALLLGITWIVDGARKIGALVRPGRRSRAALIFDGVISLVLGLAIAVQWPFAGAWAVYVATAIRLASGGWAMLLGREAEAEVGAEDALRRHPDPAMGLPADDRFAELRREGARLDEQRWPAHRYWIGALVLTFFFIHMSRMEAAWTLVGLLSPAVAVVGDLFYAVAIAYGIVLPIRLGWRLLTRPMERRAWQRYFNAGERSWRSRLRDFWLRRRLRFDLRLEAIAASPSTALRRGLQVGLPPTAVLVAVAPLLGISWYFNTETWATGLWDHWAAQRTDTWRVEMTRAVRALTPALDESRRWAVDPGPIGAEEDFSFIVIGDTGEGDASQLVLKDQLVALGERADVKFLVVSSDVIYPQGAMKDYEPRFYLPFKGFKKPIYAIPGNHDWYDALEAFSANFLEPSAARAALLARREADHRLTTTTEGTIERMIAEARTLRREYGIRAGLQRGPYFEVQTPRFALIAVDTGILRQVDEEQVAWLKGVLERSRGKFIMALPGHPIYAAGRYAAGGQESYEAFHQLLREHDVRLVMAGDTHDLEFYRESYLRDGAVATMMHVVNGGGGASLSIGTPLDWPVGPALADTAFYPSRQAIVEKLSAEVAPIKRPLWWWTLKMNAWPSTPETLASAFASNRAPFYQSFCEVRVEPSKQRVRVIPWGANGRLRWRDLQASGVFAGRVGDELVELAMPMTAAH